MAAKTLEDVVHQAKSNKCYAVRNRNFDRGQVPEKIIGLKIIYQKPLFIHV